MCLNLTSFQNCQEASARLLRSSRPRSPRRVWRWDWFDPSRVKTAPMYNYAHRAISMMHWMHCSDNKSTEQQAALVFYFYVLLWTMPAGIMYRGYNDSMEQAEDWLCVVVYSAGPGAIQSSPKMTASILYLYTLIFYLLFTSSPIHLFLRLRKLE